MWCRRTCNNPSRLSTNWKHKYKHCQEKQTYHIQVNTKQYLGCKYMPPNSLRTLNTLHCLSLVHILKRKPIICNAIKYKHVIHTQPPYLISANLFQQCTPVWYTTTYFHIKQKYFHYIQICEICISSNTYKPIKYNYVHA